MKYIIFNPKFTQYFSAFAASLGGFSAGTALAWSAAVNYLKPHDATFKIKEEDLPLAAAILNLGAMLFAIPSGKLADSMGRTPIMLLGMILFFINWILLAFATNFATILIARFLAGMGLGAVCVVNNIYLCEISEVTNRAVLCAGFSLLLSAGILFKHVIALFAYWKGYHLSSAIIPIIFFICYVVIPESPTFLVSQGKTKQARDSLERIRNPKQVFKELDCLQETHSDAIKNDLKDWKKLFSRPSNVHALISGIGVFIFQKLSNIDGFNACEDLLFNVAEISILPGLATVLMGFVQVSSTAAFIFIIQKAKRTFFLVISSVIMAVGHFGLAMYFQLKYNDINFWPLQYCPLIFAIIYLIGFCVGCGPIPWILSSELFIPSVRPYASGILVVVNWFTAFFVTYFFPIMLKKLGYHQTFYIFGGLAVLSIFFTVYVVPETKGRLFAKDM